MKIDNPDQEFGARLRKLRIKKGYAKARHFAAALQINENSYYRYERGQGSPSLELLKRICEVLEVPIAELLPFGSVPSVRGEAPRRVRAEPAGAYSAHEATSLATASFAEFSQTGYDAPPITVRVLPEVQCSSTVVETVPGSISSKLHISCSIAAWELAEYLVAQRPELAGVDSEHAAARRLTACADQYRSLKSDPFGTVCVILANEAEGDEALLPHRATLHAKIGRFLSAFRAYAEDQLASARPL